MLTLNNWNTIPSFGLWTWKSDPEVLYKAIKHAISVGYRHIDCAWIYGNEDIVGNAINDSIKEWVVKREELFVTSKVWNSFHHIDDVETACKESLEALQLDYVDMYLMHWPIAFQRGVSFPKESSDISSEAELPFQKTWTGMERLIKSGLAKNIWVSNFAKTHLEDLLETCEIVPTMNQIESHPFLQQNELIEFCKSKDIQVTAYAPLGSMDRPAIIKWDNEPILIEHPVILDIAEKHKTTPAGVLISWAIWRGTCVIPKSTSEKRIDENINSTKVILDKSDFAEIAKLDLGFRFYTGVRVLWENTSYNTDYLWGVK